MKMKMKINNVILELQKQILKHRNQDTTKLVNLIDEKAISNLDEQFIKEQEQLIREIQNV